MENITKETRGESYYAVLSTLTSGRKQVFLYKKNVAT